MFVWCGTSKVLVYTELYVYEVSLRVCWRGVGVTAAKDPGSWS